MSVQRRLAAALGANAYGYVTVLLTQIGTVPILLAAWGPTLFGEWLIVSTIPAYLMMTDFGLGMVVGNELSLSTARGDKSAAIIAFQSTNVAIFLLGLLVLLPLTFAITQMPLETLLSLKFICGSTLSHLIVMLVIQVWLNQFETLIQAGFRCEGYYAYGTTLSNTLRLIEFLSFTAAVSMGAAPVAAVACVLITRTVGTIFIGVLLHFRVPWLKIGFAKVKFNVLRSMAGSGCFFLAFPVSNALNLQTPLLMIGAVLGPESVALFSTTRTMTRAVQQLMNIINSAVWPEISRAFGGEKSGLLVRLNRTAIKASFWLCVCSVSFLSFAGPTIYGIWTNHAVKLDQSLLELLLSVMVVNSIWGSASIVLVATNRHAGLATTCLLVNLILPVACWGLLGSYGLHGAAIALLCAEIFIAIYVVRASLYLVGDTPKELLYFVINPFLTR